MDAFAEFYFGGLLDRASKDKSFEFEFHKGVRSELLGLISMDEVVSLFEILDGVIADSFGVNQTMLDLLYGGSEDDVLSDREREFARLLVDVLGEKGVFWEGEVSRLTQLIDGVEDEKKIELILDDKKINSKTWELYGLAQSIIEKLCNKKCLHIGKIDECIDYINNMLINNNLNILQIYDEKKGATQYSYLYTIVLSRLIDFLNGLKLKQEISGLDMSYFSYDDTEEIYIKELIKELSFEEQFYIKHYIEDIALEKNSKTLFNFIKGLSSEEQFNIVYYMQDIILIDNNLATLNISKFRYQKIIRRIREKLKLRIKKAGYNYGNLF